MSKEKQLIKNTSILALGKICTQFISFFLLPLYTSFLSTTEYGIVDLLNTYRSLLIPLFFLQMEQAVFRFLIDVRKKNEKIEQIISTSFFTILNQLILFIILFLITCLFIKNDYKLFLLINIIATMFSNYFLQVCRGLGDNISYSLGSLISGAATIILNVIFIAIFKFGAYGMLTATFIANVLCIIFICIKKSMYKYIKLGSVSKKLKKELLKYSIPLIPNSLSWWIVNASDRTIITYFIGVSFNGIYSVANKFSNICITAFNIFNLTWTESTSLYINDKDSSDFFSKITNQTLNIFSSICFGLIAIMPFTFKFLIKGQAYATAYHQIPILLLSTLFNIFVALLGSIYIAYKKSNEIAKTSIYSAIINIVINVLLIKKIGLYSASISTVIAYLTMSIYRYIDVQKLVRIRLNKKNIFLNTIIGIVVFTTYYMNNVYLKILSLIFTVIISLFTNKDIIKNIIKYASKKLIKPLFKKSHLSK